jgi:hypothetical protein
MTGYCMGPTRKCIRLDEIGPTCQGGGLLWLEPTCHILVKVNGCVLLSMGPTYQSTPR